LFCVGDLVNRGPKSLKVLKLLKSLDNQCITVLGNHDIHLLSMIYGVRKPRQNDTLDKVINSNDAADIADWLRVKPLLHVNQSHRFALCHAGIYPWWTLEQAQQYAAQVERVFQNEEK